MKKIINNRLIITIFSIVVLFTLTTLLKVSFENLYGIILYISIIIFIFTIIKLIHKLVNYKKTLVISKMLVYANPKELIIELEDEIKKTNKINVTSINELKFLLINAKIHNIGITLETIEEFNKIDQNKLSNEIYNNYQIQKALILINQNEIKEVEIIMNSLDENKYKEEIKLIKELIILNSEELVNQESYFLELVQATNNKNLLNYISSITLLSKYYIKMKKYNLAKEGLNYIKKYGSNTHYPKTIESLLKNKKIKDTKDKLPINLEQTNFKYNYNSIEKKVKQSIIINIILIFIFIPVFIYFIIKVNSPITSHEFINKIETYCKVEKSNYNLNTKEEYYVTNKLTCNYEIGYIEINNKNKKVIYQEIINKIKLNDQNIKSHYGYIGFPSKEDNYIGDYYSRIYKKGNTIIYAIAKKERKEEIDKIYKELGYINNPDFNSIF